MIRLELPWPPSVNHYWRHVGAKVLISSEGRRYRQHVAAAVLIAGRPTIAGRIAVSILAAPPDRRRRDLDNMLKAVLDSLAHAGVYEDDSQIDDLAIGRRPPIKGGQLSVLLQAAGDEQPGSW